MSNRWPDGIDGLPRALPRGSSFRASRAAGEGAAGLRILPLLAGVILAAILAAGSAPAEGLPGAPGIQIVTPEEVLRDYTEALPEGGLGFREAGGALVRFVTTVEDPEVTNRGDGAFHPAREEWVRSALQAIPLAFLKDLRVQVFLLPYPRSGRLSSSADARAIYLSPGVREYESWQVAFLVTHEVGHSVHRYFLPDSLREAWREWAVLRGVPESALSAEGLPHYARPHEIFAEDFRVLFGGAEARADGSVENRSIRPPEDVAGLRAFYAALAGMEPEPAVATVLLGPNPYRPGTRLVLRWPERSGSIEGGAAGYEVVGAQALMTAGIYDVTGRRVADLAFRAESDKSCSSTWDGRDRYGREMAAGAYWVRLDSAAGSGVLSLRVIR